MLDEGKLETLAPKAPVEEGAELELKLVEVGLLRRRAPASARLDGLDVVVGGAAKLVGKKVKVRIERVLDGIGYATLVAGAAKAARAPITAEGEAEKPTRKPPAKKAQGRRAGGEADDRGAGAEEPQTPSPSRRPTSRPWRSPTAAEPADGGRQRGRRAGEAKKTRRGSRGGAAQEEAGGGARAASGETATRRQEPSADGTGEPAPRIHVPDADSRPRGATTRRPPARPRPRRSRRGAETSASRRRPRTSRSRERRRPGVARAGGRNEPAQAGGREPSPAPSDSARTVR